MAAGFGAGDALVTSKVAGAGPGGIPWSVYYEGAGIAAMLFGGRVGIPAEVRDSVGLSAIALAGARLTRAALSGKLMSGPQAWGGDQLVGGDYSLADGSGGGAALPGAHVARIRALSAGRGGGWNTTGDLVPFKEAPGVMG